MTEHSKVLYVEKNADKVSGILNDNDKYLGEFHIATEVDENCTPSTSKPSHPVVHTIPTFPLSYDLPSPRRHILKRRTSNNGTARFLSS